MGLLKDLECPRPHTGAAGLGTVAPTLLEDAADGGYFSPEAEAPPATHRVCA
jgi:hypothetical protein